MTTITNKHSMRRPIRGVKYEHHPIAGFDWVNWNHIEIIEQVNMTTITI